MENNLNNEQQYQQYEQPTEDTSVMSTGQWLLTTFLLTLPCVGLILAFVWAFGNENVNRKNYCRAWLIWQVIAIVISVVFGMIMGVAMAGIMESMGAMEYPSMY